MRTRSGVLESERRRRGKPPLSNDEITALTRTMREDSNPEHRRVAYERIYQAYRRELFNLIRGLARKDQDADDISQQTWLSFWTSTPQFDPAKGDDLMALLAQSARNRTADYYRTKDRLKPVESLETVLDAVSSGHWHRLREMSPERAFTLRRNCELVLRLLFEDTGPPHQLITFGFHQLLEWHPRNVDNALSDEFLDALEKRLEGDYAAAACLYESAMRELCTPLRKKLSRCLKDLGLHGITRKLLEKRGVLCRIAGRTKLTQYYSSDDSRVRRKEITTWSFSVFRRVWLLILKTPALRDLF